MFFIGLGITHTWQWFSPNIFEVGEEASVYWVWFGNYWPDSYICFNSDTRCYGRWHTSIISRSNTKITFVAPMFTDVRWEVMIYPHDSNNVLKYNYQIAPTILGVMVWKNITSQWCHGDEVKILWVWFWDHQVWWWLGSKVFLWEKEMEITGWSDNISRADAQFLWIDPNSNFLKSVTFKIQLNAWEKWRRITLQNSAWVKAYVDFEAYGNITNDEYSCLQRYAYTIWMDKVWKSDKKLWDDIVIAVIDDGVNHNHLDLKHQLWKNKNEVPNNNLDNDRNWYIDDIYWRNFAQNSNRMDVVWDHGTMVAGIIAAKINNEIWIAWIAPNAKIMPLIIFDEHGQTNISYLIDAIRYATDNWAHIINLSLWWKFTDSYYPELDEVIAYAYNKWVVIIAAAWNGDYTGEQDRNLDIYPSSPVCNDWDNTNHVIGVWAVDNAGVKAHFSDYGSCVDISAPWINIISLSHAAFSDINVPYNIANGTSFAAPMVAAAVAVLRSNYPHLKNEQIYDMLINHGVDIDHLNPRHAGKIGKMLNVEKLMNFPIPTVSMQTTKPQNNRQIKDFSTILSRMHNKWLTKYNVISDFRPHEYITREQSAKFFTEFGKIIWLNKWSENCAFTDISNADYSLIPFIVEACQYNLLKWSQQEFRPFDNITKAEALTVVIRSLQGFKIETLTPWYLNYYNAAINLWITEFVLEELNERITRQELWELVYKAAHAY